MSQSFSLFSLFIVFLVLNFHGVVVNGDLISDVCKNASAIRSQISPNIKYDFCVASLSSNPASKHADLLGLGKISMETCLTNATSICSYIAKMLKEKREQPVKHALEDCLTMYSGALDNIHHAIASYEKKDYKKANIFITGTDSYSDICEAGFKGLTSPLTKQSGDFSQLVAISVAITGMV
ncbi:hypothetical protein MKW94_005745 [Papaver nudicaule]|uniref:Pectinesterase inhibitor domain-containing protein n=1 Tax=Papaver nudicaule TaxID=74823 RepID=A0AA41UTC1_PAPNU|nr:hypothetical protein [Papaver nudicaule]